MPDGRIVHFYNWKTFTKLFFSPSLNLTFFLSAGDRAEGAEGDLDNAPTGNVISTSNTNRSFSLEARFSFLNLRRPRVGNTKNKGSCPQKTEPGQTVVLVKGVWGANGKYFRGTAVLQRLEFWTKNSWNSYGLLISYFPLL